MGIFRSKEDSLTFGLSLFLIAGSILGSIFCNRMTYEMKTELHMIEQNFLAASFLSPGEVRQLFGRVLQKRLWTLTLVFLITAAPVSEILLMIAAGYLGFSIAAVVCLMTMYAGVWGLAQAVLLMVPQCLIYIPLTYILLWWMPVKGKKITVLSIAALTVLTILGVALESFINPWFVGMVGSM